MKARPSARRLRGLGRRGRSAALTAGGMGLAGGMAALAAARERMARDRTRFALLAAVAEVADGRLTLEETGARLCELLVPGFADICLLDVVFEGGLRRLVVRASGPKAAEREAWLRARAPTDPGQPGSGRVAATSEPLLLRSVSDKLLQGAAHDAEDLAWMRSLRMTGNLTVPLSSRGRTLGALTLLLVDGSRRRYTRGDLSFVEVVAGRVALALDNAGLFSDLETMEAQLTTALGSLAEAVTVQNPNGNLIYANQAAAEMMGLASPSDVLAAPGQALVGRYAYYHEDGTPLDPEEFPGRRALAGAEPDPLLMRVVDGQTGGQAWRLAKASAVRDSAGRLTMVVNVIADVTAVKRAESAQRLLARAGEVFNSSLELQDTLQQVADLCIPDLADWCTVRLVDEQRRQLESVAVAHTNPDRVALVADTREHYPVALDAPGGLAEVFRTGEVRCVNGISEEMLVAAASDAQHLEAMRRLAPYATLILPLRTQGPTVGVLSLVSAESRRRFEDQDIELATELARRAATAVAHARLYTERSRIAGTLQDSLLPDALPAMPGWKIASLYRPAGDEERVGGDFYEAFRLSEDRWMMVVGDVTGRGAPAAALTALMRHTLRAVATDRGSAIHALQKLNRDLVARRSTSLCTAVCLVLHESSGPPQAHILCAGHPLPILVRGGTAAYVGQFGPMLGAFPEETWDPARLSLRPGDILVLYSDGVLDASGNEDRFGPERLERTLTGAADADDAISRVERALTGFEVGAQSDDTALLAVQWLGLPEPNPHSGADEDSDSQPMRP